jgi:hypothetical protein
VHLRGASFDGSLDATTKNGPLVVKVPRGFASGVVVEATGRGPVSCHAEACENLRIRPMDVDDDGPRRFSLGQGPETVHVSTVNGPLSIREE